MESLEMFEPLSGLDDLVQILETMFADEKVSVRLEMQVERGESVTDLVLAQFNGQFDLCDIVMSELETEVALEFLFQEMSGVLEAEEPSVVTLPIDPQDVEVDLHEQKVTLESGAFTLTLTRLPLERV
ncbi:hypothetical protein CIG75_14010 [Tumebacillus algifaecis]|uniref:Uncharacterized protein n=1 Tax=Tumebacillus algifaecis TaxID=1214604 RepID=A0A223D3G5_9BACL|nr:hypothetical protein [Tumebacillus algifaecis]ASS75963.1 hypothetical protein CIG75_14010 [Tumebacillus algifaecis]